MPDQVMPDHVMPDQVMPDHVMPDQVMPDHVMPDQVMPDHVMPDQVMPDHVGEDQVMPDHVMPFQLVWFLRPAATVAALNALPRTSTSPRTSRPATFTCTEPRESSREPTPVETANDCFAATGVAVFLAFARASRPAPCCAVVARGTAVADPVRRALTWSGVSSGRCESSSAAAPETTAAACEVPLPRKSRSPMRAAGYVVSRKDPGFRRLTTFSPGATRSGLRVPSPS